MLSELVHKSGMNKSDILSQIKRDFDRGYRYVVSIRKEFQKEEKLFRNEKKKKEKLGDFTYYSVYSALMARSYVNRPEAEFEKNLGNKDIATKLNYVIKQDFEESHMEVIKYFRDSNKFKRGVGIVAKKGWDGINKCGKYKNIDPELWIPDPDGDYVNNEYSFTGFQDDIYKEDLKALSNREAINFDLLSAHRMEQDGKKRKKQRESNNTGTTYTGGANGDATPCYDVYYHFGYFNGIPAMVLTTNSNTEILKVKVLKAVTKAEKKDPSQIKFPLSFVYFVPDGTPFGMRLPLFTADAQKAKAIMNNLRVDKEMAELYPMYLRNSNLIPNKGDLEFGFNKIIDVNPLEGQSPRDALVPLQKDFRSDNSFLIENSIDKSVASSTSIDKVTQGSLPSRRETAVTNNLVQSNTDINLALSEKVEAWGEKQLLMLMLRSYQEDFTDGDVKEVSIKTSYGLVSMSLKREDFISDKVMRIVVRTRTDINKEKEKQKVSLGEAIGMIQTLPMSESSKKFLYREYFEVIGMEKEKAERIVDYTPDEIIAMINVELLDEGIFVEVKMEYDPMTHLAAIKSAKDSQNKEIYKNGLLQLYKIKSAGAEMQQMPQDQEPNPQIASNMAAQSTASLANQSQSL